MAHTTMGEAARRWSEGVGLGLRLLRHDPLLGLKRVVLPVSYWRTAEFTYAMARLASLPPGSRILDLGSPKELAVHLARRFGHVVYATDILERAVRQGEVYGRSLNPKGTGHLLAEIQDGRRLTHQDRSFDAVVCVSVLEHIPDDGDSATMKEFIRVVRPGGCIVATTPFAPAYGETFVARTVYDRQRVGEGLVFFERHYDVAALHKRLLDHPGAQLEHLGYWGEGGVRLERIFSRLGRARALLSPAEPFLAWTCLRELPLERGDRVMAAFFTLRKTE